MLELQAEFLTERKVPTLYRVHERPEPRAVVALVEKLAALDIPTPALPEDMTPQQAADEGFDYCGQTVFQSTFGGREVSVILERDPGSKKRVEFKLLATTRTSTMEKELNEAGQAGFEFLDVMVGGTAFGGKEIISLLRRRAD